MDGLLLSSRNVLLDHGLRSASVLVQGTRIREVLPYDAQTPDGVRRWELGEHVIAPGLIDLHLHGAAGYSFDQAGSEQDELAVPGILRHLASLGVTSAQASLASDALQAMVARAEALNGWRERGTQGGAELLGVHLEGPFLAAAQCGAHDPAALRAPAPHEAEALAATAPSMITLAPELPGATEAIRLFTDTGAVVAAGHSEAVGADLEAAVRSGLRHITHLWSGQSTTTRSGPWRVPGLLEESLASEDLTAEVIADGRHLPPTLLEIARRCLGERLIVVSDATSGAGMPEGYRYQLGTVECEVRDGVGMVRGADSFGGSTTTLPEMLRHLHQDLGWPLAEVLALGTSRPARIAGLQHRKGSIAPGLDADLVVLDEDLRASAVILRGAPVPCSRG